jgi:predicted nucleic acid-binding protein
MRRLTLDSSVVLKWYRAEPETDHEPAARLEVEFRAGGIRVIVPTLLSLELINVAGRKWGWSERDLADLATRLQVTGFEYHEPDLDTVATWVARGLSAYDATYVAIAIEHRTTLVTDDQHIVSIAPGIAVALADAA